MARLANGQADDARREIEAALAVGIKDATILGHAATIAAAAGDAEAAAEYARRSLDANPHSHVADEARVILQAPTTRPAS